MKQAVTIAMWSGPRNLSTALMRSFAQRRDCLVWDEPFYAAWLAESGADHPMREQCIEAGETNPDEVARLCAEKPKPPKSVFYQKQMTHHILDGFDLEWMDSATNAFLLRSPVRVLASYARKRERVEAEQLGFARQRELFDRVADRLGTAPPAIEAEDVLADPEGSLSRLCQALGIGFDSSMLSWSPGPAPEDGVWGAHWYDAIRRSTGFGPPQPEEPILPDALRSLADSLMEDFLYMRRRKLKPPEANPTG